MGTPAGTQRNLVPRPSRFEGGILPSGIFLVEQIHFGDLIQVKTCAGIAHFFLANRTCFLSCTATAYRGEGTQEPSIMDLLFVWTNFVGTNNKKIKARIFVVCMDKFCWDKQQTEKWLLFVGTNFVGTNNKKKCCRFVVCPDKVCWDKQQTQKWSLYFVVCPDKFCWDKQQTKTWLSILLFVGTNFVGTNNKKIRSLRFVVC